MALLLDLLTLVALIFLSLLTYLVLFERGTFYRTSQAIHGLDDRERLRLLSAVLATPVTTADIVHLLREGPSLYEAQLQAIRSARHSVHLEVYLCYPGAVADSILAALCERAREGLQVRLIVDAIGSFRMRRHPFKALLEAGGRVYRYHPLRLQYLRRWNSRTHRNLLITDGKVAFIGGAGIADHWSRSDPPPWRDCVVRVTGEVVAQLQAVFAENWLECAGELLVGPDAFAPPRDDTPTSQGAFGNALAVGSTPTAGGSTRARMLVQFLLAGANDTIDLCTPYFIPDVGIRRELLAAKERGVRIRIVSGGPYGDHGIVRRAGRRRYGPLLEAGIEIREYAKHMLHAKALVVDGRWCLLGSTNIDPRSFTLNDEVNVLLWNAGLAGQMREMFEEDLSRSELLSLARWRTRSWRERILASIGRLIERHQ
jgi:cardiolipin synthase